MAANRALVKERGISDESVDMIDTIHEQIEYIIDNTLAVHDLPSRLAFVRDLEFTLQDLWKFNRDSRYHTWCYRLINRHRAVTYNGVKYRCKQTGEIRALDLGYDGNVEGIFRIGKGFIDFGGVVRLVGLERVV